MSDIILLDGGMGQELYRLGYRSEQKIVWSATSLLEAPEVVQNVHEGFLQAGADVITTNSYCTNPYRLEKAGMLDHFKVMTQTACEVAAQARAKINPQARIAGALPPLYGSYQTSIQREPQKMLDEYRRMVELMQGHVDLFLCETITDISEARACAQAAHESGLPVWLAFTVSETLGADGQVVLRDGTLLSEALPRVMDLGLEALMVNCCPPEIVPMALDLLARYDGVMIGAYANGFTTIPEGWAPGDIEALGVRRDLSPDAYAQMAGAWAGQGAHIIGGCCEIGADHIQAVYNILRA